MPAPKTVVRTERLSPAEERLWFVEQRNRATPAYHLSVHYRFAGELDMARLRAALDTLIARRPALRRGFVAPGRGIAVAEAPVPLRWRDGRDMSEPKLRLLLNAEARAPFELGSPPLLRALLVERGEAGDHLLLTAHHLVCDGASLARLEAELEGLYTGAEPNETVASRAVPPRRPDEATAMAY